MVRPVFFCILPALLFGLVAPPGARAAQDAAPLKDAAQRAAELTDAGKPAEAEAVLEARWQELIVADQGTAAAVIKQYLRALDAQGRRDKVLEVTARVLTQMPQMAEESQAGGLGLYKRLVEGLTAANRHDEALQFAKLRYVLCRYDGPTIQAATAMIAKVYAARDLTRQESQAFAEALNDPAKPNPLAEVKLPPIDPEIAKAQVGRLRGRAGGWQRHDAITILLMCGELEEAMKVAKQYIIDMPERPNGVADACRVFKAADLNVQRANAFVTFMQNGEGENPMDAFFKEQQEKKAAQGK